MTNTKDKCAICGKLEHLAAKRKLCNKCDRGLEFFGNNSDTLQKAVEYLRYHSRTGIKELPHYARRTD